jgi:hypothetical protein
MEAVIPNARSAIPSSAIQKSESPLSVSEAVSLGAVDSEFYSHYFFPKTFRQRSPEMHKSIWNSLENPALRFVNLQCYRGSAKTTLLRTFCSKRIAYRVSRTILFIGGSEPAASRSIQWLRGQIERNERWRTTFGLRPGKKWHETEIEIISEVDGTATWVLGVGITSNIRGINFDDYRPDLIVADDVLTDENVLTLESRNKTTDLLLGAVAESLAPVTEEPNAKLCMLQTPLHREDASMVAAKASMWHTERFGCWTPETEDLPTDHQFSSWEDRFPTPELREKKRSMFAMGKSAVFLREQEVKIISAETSAFLPSLLSYYEPGSLVGGGTSVLSIDPVPPPSAREVSKNLVGKDFEALVVQTRHKGNYYLRHYELNRGHDPSWTLAKAFELALRYRVSYIAVDMTAYQAVLKWLLEKEMQRRRQYFSIIPDKGNRSKYQKIVDTISPLLSLRKYHILRTHTEFIEQLTEYPAVPHDDLLDCCAIGLRALINPAVELGEGEFSEIDETDYEDLPLIRRAP